MVRDHDRTLCRSHVGPVRTRGTPVRNPGEEGGLRIVRVHPGGRHDRGRAHSGNHKGVGRSSVRLR